MANRFVEFNELNNQWDLWYIIGLHLYYIRLHGIGIVSKVRTKQSHRSYQVSSLLIIDNIGTLWVVWEFSEIDCVIIFHPHIPPWRLQHGTMAEYRNER